MNVYFFRHGFSPLTGARGPIPGRCRFSVLGRSLERDGATFTASPPAAHQIYVDGFEADGPGSNVDPNVLAAKLPWFLSFCRATTPVWDLAREEDPPHGPCTLAAMVRAGDVVVFGEPVWTNAVAVDTVLCVGERVTLPARANPGRAASFSLEKDFARYWDECVSKGLAVGSMSWEAFRRSADFVLNLVDSLSSARAEALLGHPRETMHQTPGVNPQMQIVGRRCRIDSPVAAGALVDQFMAGNGFDFIPTGTLPDLGHLASRLPDVFIARFEGAKDRLWPGEKSQPSIFRLNEQDGRTLLSAILMHAEQLVHGPLEWLSPRRFSRFDADRKPEYVPVPKGHEV